MAVMWEIRGAAVAGGAPGAVCRAAVHPAGPGRGGAGRARCWSPGSAPARRRGGAVRHHQRRHHGPTVDEHVVYQRMAVDVDHWPTMGELMPVVYSPKNPDNWNLVASASPSRRLSSAATSATARWTRYPAADQSCPIRSISATLASLTRGRPCGSPAERSWASISRQCSSVTSFGLPGQQPLAQLVGVVGARRRAARQPPGRRAACRRCPASPSCCCRSPRTARA